MRFPTTFRLATGLAAAALLLLAGGCAGALRPKLQLLVDAISAPDTPKPAGKSYRLIARKSVVNQAQVQVPVVKACVDAALSGIGMYEPPANTAPDYFIEVGFGVEAGRVDPARRETYLHLSGRDNPGRSNDRPTGTEVWDVRVAVLGVAGRVETAMPLLAAVAADHLAADTRVETRIEVSQSDPRIAAVRAGAIKVLESAAPPTPAGGPPAASPLPPAAK